MKNAKVIFLHGNEGGTARDNWFPYLKKELEKLSLKVVAKDFPDPVLAREKYWLPFLKDKLKADKSTILVGHSSGAIAAARFAEKNEILGSVLVGTCHTDLGDEIEKKSGYFNHPWDWKVIKQNQKWIIQYASTDDPYIPIKEARFVHKKLNTDYHEYNNQGHFGGDYFKPEFPEIIDAIKAKLSLR